jgi:Apea-like HEPN
VLSEYAVPTPAIKAALRQSANDAIKTWHEAGHEPESLRGTAYHHPERDRTFRSLPSFDRACQELAANSLVTTRYGPDASPRLVLQFIYLLGPLIAENDFDTAFQRLWTNFIRELRNSTWLFSGVSDLRHFDADPLFLSTPTIEGVSIQGRSDDLLFRLGFNQLTWDDMMRDWSGFGASSYIILVQHRRPKTGDNLVLSSDGTAWPRAERLIHALRLLAPGDVAMSGMWLARAAHFDVGAGAGMTKTGWSLPGAPGASTYQLTPSIVDQLPRTYRQLKYLAENSFKSAPGNLDLALRSFMATYDRWPFAADSQVIDAVTALEAMLGTESEITFRLSLRVAGLLGATPSETEEIFGQMKRFYDARSKLVHGGALRRKHRDTLKEVHLLRDYTRRILLAFVRLGSSRSPRYDRAFFVDHLDLALLDDTARRTLQRSLRLAS